MLLAMGQGFYGQRKFLWGNVPALDIINMEANEGLAYNKPLNLLFAGTNGCSSNNSRYIDLQLMIGGYQHLEIYAMW